jgi:hypothetical protein
MYDDVTTVDDLYCAVAAVKAIFVQNCYIGRENKAFEATVGVGVQVPV